MLAPITCTESLVHWTESLVLIQVLELEGYLIFRVGGRLLLIVLTLEVPSVSQNARRAKKLRHASKHPKAESDSDSDSV